jgi:hypothetical protein
MKATLKYLFIAFGAIWAGIFSTSAQCENPPELVITEDYTHHCQNDELTVEITNAFEPSCDAVTGNYTYCHGENENTVFSYCADTPGDGSQLELIFNSGTIESGWDTVDVYDGPDGTGELLATLDGDLSGISFQSSNGCLSFVLTSDVSVSCQSGSMVELNYDVVCLGTEDYYDFSWEPANLLENATSSTATLTSLEADQEFTVIVTEVNNPECFSTASVMVTYASDYQFGEDTSIGLCSTEEAVDMTSLLNGGADVEGSWSNDQGDPISGIFDPSQDTGGNFYYSYEFCEERGSELEIIVVDPPSLATEDIDLVCDNEIMSVSINGYNGQCSEDAGYYNYCYGNGESQVFTYCPSNPEFSTMTLEFISGFMEVNYDYLTIFDGPDTNSPVLANFDGNVEGLVYTASEASGCITFLLESDGSICCATGEMPLLEWDVSCTADLPEYNVSWNNEEFLSDAQAQVTNIMGLTENQSFSVEVEPVIAPGCTSTAEVMVSFIDNINLGENTLYDICLGEDVFNLLDAMNGEPDLAGTWFDGAGNEVTNPVFDPSNDPSQIFTYAYEGCNTASSLNIQVRPIPPVNAGEDQLICEGQPVTLQAGGAETYVWEGLGEQPVEVTPLETTTYVVTGTNEFGCSAMDEVTIMVESNPLAQITETDGVLSVEGGLAWQWYVDGLPILGAANQSFTPMAPGTYTVVINPESECEVFSEPFIVTGLEELLNSELSLYPQPFQNSLNISSPIEIKAVMIYDLRARVVYSETLNSFNSQLDLDLPAGPYIIELSFVDFKYRRSLLKK